MVYIVTRQEIQWNTRLPSVKTVKTRNSPEHPPACRSYSAQICPAHVTTYFGLIAHCGRRRQARSNTLPRNNVNSIQTGGGGGAFEATQDLNPLFFTNDCVYSVPTSLLFLKFTWEQFGVVEF